MVAGIAPASKVSIVTGHSTSDTSITGTWRLCRCPESMFWKRSSAQCLRWLVDWFFVVNTIEFNDDGKDCNCNCNCKYDKLYSTVGGKPLLGCFTRTFTVSA